MIIPKLSTNHNIVYDSCSKQDIFIFCKPVIILIYCSLVVERRSWLKLLFKILFNWIQADDLTAQDEFCAGANVGFHIYSKYALVESWATSKPSLPYNVNVKYSFSVNQ